MSDSGNVVLLVDPDQHARALLASHLQTLGCSILQASDATSALQIVNDTPISVLVTELYLAVGPDQCLIHAVRRDPRFRKTRIAAHTRRAMTADREWAMRAGADAYLIKPTRAQRVRYVVSRLLSARLTNASLTSTTRAPMVRRDSLDAALGEIEGGVLADAATIVFGRSWWDQLSAPERKAYRSRAKGARISLRSDSMLGNHFVEVRGLLRDEVALSTERPESPYRPR